MAAVVPGCEDSSPVLPSLSLFLSYNQHTSFIFSSHHCSQLVNIRFSKLKYECSCCFVVVKFCNLKLNFILYFVNIYKVNLIVNIYRHYSLFLQFQAVVVPSVFVCFFLCAFILYFSRLFSRFSPFFKSKFKWLVYLFLCDPPNLLNPRV